MVAAGATTSLLAQTSAFTGQDVGGPQTPGSFTPNADGTITITGSGADIWNNADIFYYYYTSVTGLVWEAKMRVVSFTGPDYWSKVELMVRRPSAVGTAPDGPDPELNIEETQANQQNEIEPQWRGTRAGGSGSQGTGIPPSYPNAWLRITRSNTVFALWYGTNGTSWKFVFSQDTATTANGFDGTAWENPILVGAAVTSHNTTANNPATAVVSNLVVTVYPVTAPTTATVVTPIQSSVTAYQYTEASFNFAATNNAKPGIFGMQYAWYKNNQLVSTNPMGPWFTFLTTPADNGAHIYAVASVAYPDYSSISVTSAVSTLTLNPGPLIYTNGLKREIFANAVRQDVEDGSVPPGVVSMVSAADVGAATVNAGVNYAERFSGYFIPPTSGAYVFFINSDDDSDLYLSTDSSAANKRLIAQEASWSNPYDWLQADGTAATASQKRSDTWSPDGGATTPYANGISLTGGSLYYLEAVHWQGGGGVNMAITYQTTNEIGNPNWATVFTNGVLPRLAATNHNIALITWPGTNLTWTLQPTNLSVFEGDTALFYSTAFSDSEMVPVYQWYINGAPYKGATSPSLSLPLVTTNNTGSQIYVIANTAEGGLSITSAVVTLTVQAAVWEPGFAKDERWDNANRGAVESGGLGAPGYTMSVPGWEVSTDNGGQGQNFARRLSGFFVPPTSGRYVFFVNSDDDSDLFVSTDNTPANKRLVAQETSWSNPFDWLTSDSTSGVASQKRSDTWSPDGGATVPYSAGISLNAGQKYYMEQDYSQGGGGANLEATFKLTTDPDPGNGADTRLKGDAIGLNAVRCTYVAFTQEPTNVTVPPFGYASFTALGATDSKLAIGQITGGEASYTNTFIFYQWQTNGVDVPGANGPAFVFGPILPGDNGKQVMCRIRALGYADNSYNRLWSNSVTATVIVSPQPVFEPGWAQVEWWATGSPTRVGVEGNTVGPAQYLYATPKFETSINGEAGDNYANRVTGFVVPPTSGNYVFFLNSDDDSDLFLSTDSTPANKRLIAQETGWSSSALGWGLAGGGGDSIGQRRSDQFVNPTTGTQPYPSGVPLVGGQMYYLEGVHHEGSGGDYFAATYKLVADLDPVSGTDSILAGNAIGFYASRIPWVAFLEQPQSQTVTSGGNAATFTVQGTNPPCMVLGTTGDPRPLFSDPTSFLMYQWYKNGTPIPGATGSSYTQVPVLPSDNHSQYVCGMRALGYANNSLNPIFSNSVVAVLTVITDTAPPTLSYAVSLVNSNQDPPLIIVDVTFNKWMDTTTLGNIANYSIPGATITNVSVASNNRTVQLLLSSMPTLPLSVTVHAARDLSGNALAANSSVAITTQNLTFNDVGVPSFDPAYPSFVWSEGGGGYIVSAEGSDIWGTADAFCFGWEMKTNNFDVVVRGVSNGHTSQYAKMGLMVRETLDTGSRDWNIVNDPSPADGVLAPDGSGYGANNVECNARTTNNMATASWANLGANASPAYPNAWIRLKRTGNVLDAYSSTDGQHWLHLANMDTAAMSDAPLANPVYVGLCTTAHNNDPIPGPPPPPFLYYNTAEYGNYTSSYAPEPQLSISHTGGNVTVSWAPAGGHLESSPAISGAGVSWQPAGSANPATIAIGAGPQFFRVVSP
jgi:PA14 domain